MAKLAGLLARLDVGELSLLLAVLALGAVGISVARASGDSNAEENGDQGQERLGELHSCGCGVCGKVVLGCECESEVRGIALIGIRLSRMNTLAT